MRTPRDFDYDIWKDDNGYYYVRVKRTGETTRVSAEVVRELWRELYRMEKHRRDTTIAETDGSHHSRIYSLDSGMDASEDLRTIQNEPWLISRNDPFADVETRLIEQDFMNLLTDKQRAVYRLHFKLGMTAAECAAHNHTSVRNVEKLISALRKKAKDFF